MRARWGADSPIFLKKPIGIGEVGVTVKPTKNLPLFVDLGVQGYFGDREGVMGTLRAKYSF